MRNDYITDMITRFFVLLVSLISGFSCLAQSKLPLDPDLPKLNGRIKTLIQITDTIHLFPKPTPFVYKRLFTYNEGGKCTSILLYDTRGIVNTIDIKYNEKGQEIARDQYAIKSGPGKNDIKEQYKYDDDGHLIEAVYFFPGQTKMVMKYDKKGNWEEEEEYFMDSLRAKKMGLFSIDSPLVTRFHNTFDTKGLLTEAVSYVNGKLSLTDKYLYDAKGRLIQYTRYNPEGRLTFKEEDRYDTKDRLNECIWSDSLGRVTVHSSRVFDKHGNAKELVFHNKDGTISSVSETKYRYDKHGNWTKCIGRSGKNESITTRILEYY